jgi:hypothetical protein
MIIAAWPYWLQGFFEMVAARPLSQEMAPVSMPAQLNKFDYLMRRGKNPFHIYKKAINRLK